MNYRKIWLLFVLVLLPVCASAFRYGGGGSFVVYQNFDFTDINAKLELQDFPILNEHAIGYGGKGYGVVAKSLAIGGEGYSILIKRNNDNKSSTIAVEAGGCYLGKVLILSDQLSVRLGGSMGNYSKTLTLYEKTDNPLVTRDYSILKQRSVFLKPQIDFEYKITSFLVLEMGVGKTFELNVGQDSLDAIKIGPIPELSLFLGFGY